jgi:hypothetical protein
MDAIELIPIWDPFQRPNLPSRSKVESKQDSRQSSLFVSAGLTACFTSSLYNSLDCLRVRWQVQNGPSQNATISSFARSIIQKEGFWKGLWQPGIVANAAGMGTSAALRFGYYETVRDSLYDKESSSKNGVHMILAGSIVGSIAYFITTPFHLIKTLSQAEAGATTTRGLYLYGPRAGMKPYITGLRSGLVQIVADQGYRGLWRGWAPLSIRGAMFTSGQMLGYDGCKTFCKYHDMQDGPILHTISSIVAALGATILSTPPDYVMARYMSNSNLALSSIVQQIYKEHGILGFWKGSSISFFRVTPVMLTWSIVYEQLRYQLGIGYMS